MTNKRLNQDQIFTEAADIADAAARHAYLDQACAGDRQLRGEIEELLRLDKQAGSFLESWYTFAIDSY